MAYMDRVRFVAGDEQEDAPVKVWQGFDADTTNGSAGFAMVYVTAETLRQMAEYEWDSIKDNAFDRLHNAPVGFWERLAFGGTYTPPGRDVRPDVVAAPDGVTPLYLVGEWSTVIVQRFNPNAGQTYDIKRNGETVGVGFFGQWENVTPVVGTPEPVGFVVNEQDWREGRSDTPPFLGEGDEDPEAPERVAVAAVTIEYTDGSKAAMTFEPDDVNSGTTYEGQVPKGNLTIETAVSEAVTNAGLWPA